MPCFGFYPRVQISAGYPFSHGYFVKLNGNREKACFPFPSNITKKSLWSSTQYILFLMLSL